MAGGQDNFPRTREAVAGGVPVFDEEISFFDETASFNPLPIAVRVTS